MLHFRILMMIILQPYSGIKEVKERNKRADIGRRRDLLYTGCQDRDDEKSGGNIEAAVK